MRVYTREEFMKLPAGTMFAKGKPWYFGGMSVKADTWETDFVYLGLQMIEAHDSGQLFDRLEEMLKKGASYPLEDAYGRDGCFDKDDVFLVYERDDLLALRTLVDEALDATTQPTPSKAAGGLPSQTEGHSGGGDGLRVEHVPVGPWVEPSARGDIDPRDDGTGAMR